MGIFFVWTYSEVKRSVYGQTSSECRHRACSMD